MVQPVKPRTHLLLSLVAFAGGAVACALVAHTTGVVRMMFFAAAVANGLCFGVSLTNWLWDRPRPRSTPRRFR